jgi:hypothetical protein
MHDLQVCSLLEMPDGFTDIWVRCQLSQEGLQRTAPKQMRRTLCKYQPIRRRHRRRHRFKALANLLSGLLPDVHSCIVPRLVGECRTPLPLGKRPVPETASIWRWISSAESGIPDF